MTFLRIIFKYLCDLPVYTNVILLPELGQPVGS